MVTNINWFIQDPEMYEEKIDSLETSREVALCKIIVDADSEIEITHFGGKEAAVKLAESIVTGGNARANWTIGAPKLQKRHSLVANIPPVCWSTCQIDVDPSIEIMVRHRGGTEALMRLVRAITSGKTK